MKVKALSRVRFFETLMDCSLPGFSIHGIFQARVLEWGAIAFSTTDYINILRSHREFSFYVLSHVQLFVTPWTVAHQAPLSMELYRQKYGSRLLFPFSVDFPDLGVEPMSSHLLLCRWFTTEPLKTPIFSYTYLK